MYTNMLATHARVLEGVKSFKSVAGYALPKLIFCRIQGEFLQKLTFCTISFRWTNPFLHSGVGRRWSTSGARSLRVG